MEKKRICNFKIVCELELVTTIFIEKRGKNERRKEERRKKKEQVHIISRRQFCLRVLEVFGYESPYTTLHPRDSHNDC
jgi:hypothetical protein